MVERRAKDQELADRINKAKGAFNMSDDGMF